MSPDRHISDNTAWVLRLAFVVTLGLVVETLRGALLPPLAPVLALQILAASRVPPDARMIVMMLIVAVGTSGLAYLVAAMTVDFTGLYAIGVGLLYLWGFVLALQKKTAIIGVLSITMTVVVTGLASTSTGLALSLATSLVLSVAQAFALVFLAYLVFPGSGTEPDNKHDSNDTQSGQLPIGLHALIATLVILPAHVYLSTNGVASMVVLLTMATMLRQPGIAQSTQYCVAFAAGQGFGALIAAVAVFLVTVQPHIPVLVVVTTVGALILSCLLARGGRWVPVILPGYVAYTVLYGIVLSPLPITNVAVVDRVVLIVSGGVYAIAFLSLLVPLVPFLSRLTSARTA